jgi:hypothetical protein
MRVSLIIFCTTVSFFLWTCQNLEDASPSNRQTFIHLYEGPYGITAHDLEIVSDGFVIVGEMSVPPSGSAVDSIVTVVFKVDKMGNRIGDFRFYSGGSGKSIIHHPTGGYIVVGDWIKKNLDPPNVANGLISSAHIMLLGENLDSLFSDYRTDVKPDSIPKTDYYGGSVTIDAGGNVIVLGTYIEGSSLTQVGVPERTFIRSYTKNATSLALNWEKDYDLIDRNFKNAKSVHTNNNNIIWAAGIARTVGEVTNSYVEIPYVQQNSEFINDDKIGETASQLYTAADIQPAKSAAFGYGVVGTYSQTTDGSEANIFFMNVDAGGTIIDESVRYFDGIDSKESGDAISDSTASTIVDEGGAITSTYDGGFVVAGSLDNGTGNGEKDIFLAKISAPPFYNVIWVKTIGGSGAEVVSAIKETSDRGLLICGTNTLSGAANVFLIKTDKNGELKN